MRIKNVLVICVGNICRSPMAAFFLAKQNPELNIDSAGIAGLTGHFADEKAIRCMEELGIDISAHIAKKLDAGLIKWADLILVMSTNQQKHIEQTWPFAKGKTFRLGHWQHQNVPDPYQHDQAFFDNTCRNIRAYVKDWQDKFNM